MCRFVLFGSKKRICHLRGTNSRPMAYNTNGQKPNAKTTRLSRQPNRGSVNTIGFCTNHLDKTLTWRILEVWDKLHQLKVTSNYSLMHLHLSWDLGLLLVWKYRVKLLKQCNMTIALLVWADFKHFMEAAGQCD